MKTYVLIRNGELVLPNRPFNKRGFYRQELTQINDLNNYDIVCIEDEIEKYHLLDLTSNCFGLEKEVFHFKVWYEAYADNNLKGFTLPIEIENNREYRNAVEQCFLRYMKYLNRPAFVYEKETLNCIENECKLIIQTIDDLINGNEKRAEETISQLLKPFLENPFLVSDLDKSYSFRGIAPFIDLRTEGYDECYAEMMNTDLTFYRVRTKSKNDKQEITDVNHMLHLPYHLRHRASGARFSAEGLPGLYLGATTYVCSKETNWNGSDELYASVFILNSQGKKLKVLNLTISQALINGMYDRIRDGNNKRKRELQNSMLKIFPLVIATSFRVKYEEKIKYQYLLSQALMRAANINGIDGIAYLSMKGENEFQYPQGVNLAIPANDISESNLYSKKCKGFFVSKPVLFCGQKSMINKSYINEIYRKYDSNRFEVFTSKLNVDGEMKFYGDTCYGKFDNYVLSTMKKKDECGDL